MSIRYKQTQNKKSFKVREDIARGLGNSKEKVNDPLTEKIIKACFKVHNELGAGFVERVYQNALLIELSKDGLKAIKEPQFNAVYEGEIVGSFFVDIIVEGKVILELKSLSGDVPSFMKYQILSYLKASGIKTGLLVNFGNKSCQIRRFVY